MRLIFKRSKVMKKIVRYGNLDSALRPNYWKRISDQDNLIGEIMDLAGVKLHSSRSDQNFSIYETILAKIEAEEAAMLTSEEFKQDACNRLPDRVRDEI